MGGLYFGRVWGSGARWFPAVKRSATLAIAVMVGSLCLAALALVGVDRSMVALFGSGLFDFLRPSVADVLDGRAANSERLAALSRVSSRIEGFQVGGTDSVATQIFTSCMVGKNNWKVHDGYRLSCDAAARRYFAWSGDFDATRRSVHEALGSMCSATGPTPETRIPVPGLALEGETYSCSDGTGFAITFATSEGLKVDDSIVSQGVSDERTRDVSGPGPDELLAALTDHKWFVVVQHREEFFDDQP